MQAVLRQTRISPKKANLIAGLVRGKNVNEALNLLKFTPKKGAAILAKVIKSAAANATNNFKQDKSTLYIKEIIVTEGATYKRSMPASRGRTHPILKRNSHITVKVDVKISEDKKKKVAKKEAVAEEKAEKVEKEELTTN
ncbi:50S ribosomal protein L22 [Candidatus Peregrinibacteria bacterium CG22_combo_CG10-13_8_21_14_all_44_10]|nr:MAG: 50S ribosomal protein L22 [Candidatus Peregrinibacteria bacterium CG22_combo_CG10-13_8_21_14_all_44_10]PIS03629.1 MAG: 50S ribosomal protein L22 [Candidatus Peregrinibacteria bacterium CG10_big_fil_rev_8_21_14_0_10_44_7]PIX78891.1 MAG: 50S ribosomal protein L22 [Candidatus Peregrinibacteria bacterium CG_4_10_14_3_um_filter_44_21]PJB88858.1 MAG: 50S ribosomal protein L22 [Candidatus Peregrinibacteria bacterium CG_4_9_14_0_8_um_filter_44_15]